MNPTGRKGHNGLKTFALMAALTALLVVIGQFVGGPNAMILFAGFAVVMNLAMFWFSAPMALKMSKAREVSEAEAPELHHMVASIAQRAGVPKPKVYITPSPQPNAFATGRNPQNAAVAVTTGLMQSLSREELAGVVAHELAHIKHHDTLLMTVTATIAGAISMLAQFGMFFGGNRNNNGTGIIGSLAMMILAPLGAMLVQMAISRTREYAADEMGARICGQPMWLASALSKIENFAHQVPNEDAERAPATAHMFIINPLSGRGMDNLFATHPSTANRVAALQQLSSQFGGGFAPPSPPRPASSAAPRGPWNGGSARRGPWG